MFLINVDIKTSFEGKTLNRIALLLVMNYLLGEDVEGGRLEARDTFRDVFYITQIRENGGLKGCYVFKG